MAGEILDVVAEKVSASGAARALYGFTDAVHAVCKQMGTQKVDQLVERWTAHGHWKERSPLPIQKRTYEFPRAQGGGRAPKQRAIDLHGVEELVRHFYTEDIESFRDNYGFVDRETPALGVGDKRARVGASAVASAASGDETRWVGAFPAACRCTRWCARLG